ncbi:MAG: DUF1588 domain-containing protein [Planctomycetota bacterium]
MLAPFLATTLQASGPVYDRGKKIYEEACASCHGEKAEGNEDYYPDALIGDDSPGQLADLIADTMPEGEPELCEGEDALAVATYLHEAFYGEAAQLRNRPPRRLLQRLTANQLRQSLADLYASLDGLPSLPKRHGVNAKYFDGDRWKKDKLRIERIDPYIDFDFGRASPGESISEKEFYILWSGGLKIEQSGRYEIVVNSSLSMTMKFGGEDEKLIDNHVQSGGKTEFRRSLWLTAGRTYPFSIEFIQRKRKTELPSARIRFAWVPPNDVEHTVPTRNLVADWVPSMRTAQIQLPPDDRSYGYERGIAVSRQWDDSTTSAALEFASLVHQDLWPRYQKRKRKEKGSNREKLSKLLTEIVQLAFRGSLDEATRKTLIEGPMSETPDDLDAIKRVLLAAMKSPRFLYPTLDLGTTNQRRALNRLSLVLHDSLPVADWLVQDANDGGFSNTEAIRAYAKKLAEDPRTHAKLADFYRSWLNLDHLHDLIKDEELFPGFDERVAADLQRSLQWELTDLATNPQTKFSDFFTRRSAYTSVQVADYFGETWRPLSSGAPKDHSPDASTDDSQTGKHHKQSETKKPNSIGKKSRNKTNSPDSSDKQAKPDQAGSKSNGAANREDTSETAVGENGSDDEVDDAEVSDEVFGLVVDQPQHLIRSGDADSRHGLLNHPYLMGGLAYHDSTSPIHRGVFLIRFMLGRTLRPPNAAFAPFSADLHPELTTRQRVELQTDPESCQVCHSKINALGFALENLDATGRFRESESNQPIDARGGYTDRNGDRVEFNGVADLADYLSSSDDAVQGFVHRLFQHFTKQPPAAYGPGTLDRLITHFRTHDHNVRDLVVEIATIAASTELHGHEDQDVHVSRNDG